jgi:hypothetical protein
LAKELSDEEKAALRESTLEAAAVLIDDLDHIRKILAQPEPTAGDIRRLTAQLRRILIERDLALIAAPRFGRIFLEAPDVKPIATSNRSNPMPFYSAGGAEIFKIQIASVLIENNNRPRTIAGYNPDARVLLKIDNFITQNVVCFRGEWISRGDIIKYIANVAHGVHTGTIKESSEQLIRKVRHAWKLEMKNGQPNITANVNVFSNSSDLPANVDQKAIDCALVEVLAAASFVVNSPNVISLEAIIANEIASRG